MAPTTDSAGITYVCTFCQGVSAAAAAAAADSTQYTTLGEPGSEAPPLGQGAHALAACAPCAALNVLAGQGVHAPAPSTSLKKPAGQREHCVGGALPLLLKVPEMHVRHCVEPALGANWPGAQGTQATPPPAPCVAIVPAGQGWQGEPGWYWKKPAAQGAQAAAVLAPALAE